jgi:hypothetical protein
VGNNFSDEKYEFFLLEGILSWWKGAVFELGLFSEECNLLDFEIDGFWVVERIDGDPISIAGDTLIWING